MPVLTCDISRLANSRPSILSECLSGISPVRPYVSPKSRQYEFLLVASYGGQLSDALREWNFPSTVDSIQCRYIERWLPAEATDQEWKLRHAYFHLYKHFDRNKSPEEIFAFHWEPEGVYRPNEGEEYERRPHLHFAFAPNPLFRSHFAITLTVAPDGQANVDYLDALLNEVVDMVRVEILNRILSNPRVWR